MTPEDELDEQLFQEMRSLEVKEGSLIFINVGRQTPTEVCERIRGSVETLLDKMGYDNVAVLITMGELSVDAVRAEDRETWLRFLQDSIQELRENGVRI